jgi:hypothetical protein
MSEKLLPCPFCGASEVKLYQNCNMSWVACISCGLEAPSETGVTNVQAVNYWNTRAASSVSDHQSAKCSHKSNPPSPPQPVARQAAGVFVLRMRAKRRWRTTVSRSPGSPINRPMSSPGCWPTKP